MKPARVRKAPGVDTPLGTRLAEYGYWALWVGVVFIGTYPFINWLTAQRSEHFTLYLPAELALPLVPWFMPVYLSMFAMFLLPAFFLDPPYLRRLGRELIVGNLIAAAVFLLLPAKLGFARALPVDGAHDALFANLHSIDHPHNLVPSLHVAYSAAICLAIMARVGWPLRLVFGLWLMLIMTSTVLVHQHHLLDVASGFALAVLMRWYVERKHA